MSIATNIQRIIDAKDAIRTSVNNQGGSISADAKIDTYATAISNLSSSWDAEFKKLIKGENAYLTIPSRVTGSIGTYPFTNKTNLVGIDFSNTTVNRFDGSFNGCTNLEECILYSGFTTLGSDSGFTNCTSLKEFHFPTSYTGDLRQYSFANCTSLTSVTLADTWNKAISGYCFDGCSSLQTMNLPSGVTRIGGYAFRNTGLTGISIPSGCQLYYSVFYNCTALTGEIIFSDTKQTNIPESVLYNCSSITSVHISSIATGISTSAFYNCSSLSAITLPNTIKNISSSAFTNCSSISAITIPTGLTYFGDYVFYNCSNLSGSVIIPSTVTSSTQGNYAFYNCSNLQSLVLPSGMTSIRTGICWNCSSLTSVTISSSATAIGTSAFTNCSSLSAITLPSTLTSIYSYAFSGCTSLNNVNLPDSLTYLGNYAFAGCTSLDTIHFPTGLTMLGSGYYDGYQFQNCGFKTLIIPDHITEIGKYNFAYNSQLHTVVVGSGITTIREYAFAYCPALTGVTITAILGTSGVVSNIFRESTNIKYLNLKYSSYCSDLQYLTTGMVLNTLVFDATYFGASYITNIKEVVLGSHITGVTNWAFAGGSSSISLLERVVFNDACVSIGPSAFQYSNLHELNCPSGMTTLGTACCAYCSLLSSVTLPLAATALPSSMFQYCTSLSSITIPSNFTSLGDTLFRDCTALTSIYIENPTPPTISSSTFAYLPNNCIFYVPAASVSAYQGATNWSNYASRIQAIP